MTRKEYKLIAETVRDSKLTPLAKVVLAEDLADAFEKADKMFKREPFLEWAGQL